MFAILFCSFHFDLCLSIFVIYAATCISYYLDVIKVVGRRNDCCGQLFLVCYHPTLLLLTWEVRVLLLVLHFFPWEWACNRSQAFMFCLFFRELVLLIISAVMFMGVVVEDLFMIAIFDINSLEIVKRLIII